MIASQRVNTNYRETLKFICSMGYGGPLVKTGSESGLPLRGPFVLQNIIKSVHPYITHPVRSVAFWYFSSPKVSRLTGSNIVLTTHYGSW